MTWVKPSAFHTEVGVCKDCKFQGKTPPVEIKVPMTPPELSDDDKLHMLGGDVVAVLKAGDDECYIIERMHTYRLQWASEFLPRTYKTQFVTNDRAKFWAWAEKIAARL
jgi:hypothetical protein